MVGGLEYWMVLCLWTAGLLNDSVNWKLEHRSWAAHLGASLVHWSSERSWTIGRLLLCWGRRWYTV
eukprot:scaffold38795_cov33-Attheya_sp.AAC.2